MKLTLVGFIFMYEKVRIFVLNKSVFNEVFMEIKKVELDAKIEFFIEAEQKKYETSNGISCNYTPFCFVAKNDDEIAGAVSGASFFSEIYIDELVVKDEYRGKGIGTKLIRAVEECFSGKGFTNINLCTNGFQDAGEQIVLIDSDYEQTIKKLLD